MSVIRLSAYNIDYTRFRERKQRKMKKRTLKLLAVTSEVTAEPTAEVTAEPTEEPAEVTAEPTDEPVNVENPDVTGEPVDVTDDNGEKEHEPGVVETGFEFSGITEDGKELDTDDVYALLWLIEQEAKDGGYSYVDTEMTMTMGEQEMSYVMTAETFKRDNIERIVSRNNMLGTDMVTDTYTVYDEEGNATQYSSLDGGETWTKSTGGSSSASVIGDSSEFASKFH